MALTKVPNELSSTPSIVDGGNTTAITIDSSENVLLNTSATDTAATGFRFRAGLNAISSVSDGGISAYLGRRSSDGDILAVRRDDNIIGSIGVLNSALTIGTGDTGIQFNADNNAIIPHNISTGANVDASIDIGFASGGTNRRFKDLYLSGGAYLGGTASANKLDLYETGTFTPVLKGSTATGSFTAGSGTTAKYVAIGDTVTISIALRDCTLSGASGDIYIDGCPFTLSVGVNYPIGGFMSHNLSFDTAHHQSFYGQSDNIYGMQSRTGTSWIGWPVTNSSGIYLHITMVCTKV